VARAQNIPEIDIENDPGYKETQEFLAKTQNIIEKSRAETNAQAKDLEALANRVGELISNIGSTNEDASNLRSELSVQTDLLNIERETTEGLRRQMLILSKNMDTQKKIKADIEAKLQSMIASLRAGNAEGKKRLSTLEAEKKKKSDIEAKLQSVIASLRAENAEGKKRLSTLEAEKKKKSEIKAKLQSVIASLRAENTKGKKRLNTLEAQKKSSSTLEDRLRAQFVSVRTEHDKALKRLNQDLENITRLTNSNRAMVSDLRAAKAEVERLKKEIRLVKEKLVLPEKNSAR
jgi:chromosome segregation ATPase